MSDELVKRLRGDWFGYEVSLKAIDAMEEAADRIEQLTAERDHAWAMAAKADTQMGQSLADNLQAKAERDEAWAYMSAAQGDLYDAIMIEAERDRLREALIELIQQTHNCERELTEDLHHVDFCGESVPLTNAREALKGETP